MKSYQERTQNIVKKTKKEKAKRRMLRAAAITAACAVAITSGGLVLFLPYPNQPDKLAQYENSEYYSIIRTVDRLTKPYTSEPTYKNNFEKWTAALKDVFSMKYASGGDMDMTEIPEFGAEIDSTTQAPGDSGAVEDSTYEEVTNNQVQGVVEGDLFKRTGEYIFHLRAGENPTERVEDTYDVDVSYVGNGYILSTYVIDQNDSKRVGRYAIVADMGMRFYTNEAEMYLSQDGETVTVVTPAYDGETLYTAAIALDVSDPANITEKNRQYVSGDYITSRLTDGKLLLVSNFRIRYNPDFDDPAEYLPQVGGFGEMETLPAADIYMPDNASAAKYTVITALDCDSLTVTDSYAFLAYSENVYVSENNVFTTRTHYTRENTEDGYKQYNATDISCVSYGEDGLALKGTATVKGTVKDQYSMDEHENVLRVFTTYSASIYKEYVQGENASIRYTGGSTSASLFCVSLDSFETVASVEEFAPQGETVQSARFDGDKAYVCTAIVMTDPVFAFDLSDLSNVTYTDTGEIKGYSFSLTKFKDGTLLGIGYDEYGGLKIELYEETATAVESVAVYVPTTYTPVSEDYKAYFIDGEKGYIGFQHEENKQYVLLEFDGYNLQERACVDFLSNVETTRACLIDGWLYVVGDHGLKAITLTP